jgi:hypothetical protein
MARARNCRTSSSEEPCFLLGFASDVVLMSTPLSVRELKSVQILHYGRGHSCEICRKYPVRLPILAALCKLQVPCIPFLYCCKGDRWRPRWQTRESLPNDAGNDAQRRTFLRNPRECGRHRNIEIAPPHSAEQALRSVEFNADYANCSIGD